jgi:hypothetical protein
MYTTNLAPHTQKKKKKERKKGKKEQENKRKGTLSRQKACLHGSSSTRMSNSKHLISFIPTQYEHAHANACVCMRKRKRKRTHQSGANLLMHYHWDNCHRMPRKTL